MSDIFHLNAGAERPTRLVLDERDRFELLELIVAAFGPRLLAYCVMRTHVHVVAQGERDELVATLTRLLAVQARRFRARHRVIRRLRGAVEANQATDAESLGYVIAYVH